VDEGVVLLKATCQSCGTVAEVGYIHGRARVTVTEFLCERCGTKGTTTPSSPRTSLAPRQKRIGPRPSSRHRRASARATQA
jgi:hypothetical protein